MKNYDFFISYSRKDSAVASFLYQMLSKEGYTCFYDMESLRMGSFMDQITEAVRHSDAFLLIISHNSIVSEFILKELAMALEIAESRAKQIIPLYLDNALFTSEDPLLKKLSRYQGIDASGDKLALYPEAILDRVKKTIDPRRKKALLYEEYSAYIHDHLYMDACNSLTEIGLLLTDIINWAGPVRPQYSLFMELDKCLYSFHHITDKYAEYWPDESSQTGQKMQTLISRIQQKISEFGIRDPDLYWGCWMIRFLYWQWTILWDCNILGPDISMTGINRKALDACIKQQEPYCRIYEQANLPGLSESSEEIVNFLLQTKDYFLENKRAGAPGHLSKQDGTEKPVPAERNGKLEAIAGYIREGNRIFEMISDDEKAAAFIRCLITSYERLRNYCREIGVSELTAECIRRIEELKEKLRKREDSDETEHTVAEKGIRALLGFSRPGTGNYDVFLSHRGYDTDIARNVYQFLKSQMQEVFFDAVSLSEELSEEEYEQAIFDSLDHSTHFVAIVTDAKELMPGCKPEERDWLQEEMIAFRHELIEHRKNGKFLILVTDSVYQEFNKANKINMDIRWRQYSLIRINEFQDQIMGYLSRKDPEG